MTVSRATLSEIEDALKEYSSVVTTSGLSASSQAIYIDQANNFVRWLKGEFTPGIYVNPFPLKKRSNLRQISTTNFKLDEPL